MDGFDVVLNYIIGRLQRLLFILWSCYHNWGWPVLNLRQDCCTAVQNIS